MNQPNALVMRQTMILWIGSGLLSCLNIVAATSGDPTFVKISLALTAAFALFGVAFGVWAARTITRQHS